MSTYKLPYRPVLQQDESPASLLIRAAEGNGFESVLHLFSACGIKHYGVHTLRAILADPARYGQVLGQLGLNTAYASAVVQRSKPTRYAPRLLGRTAIPEQFFREDASAFCPLCLNNDRYWRHLWTLRPYSVCHVHGISLLNCCPECHRIPALSRGRLSVCECDSDWAQAVAISEDSKPVQWLCDQLDLSADQLFEESLAFWLALEEFDGLGDDLSAELWRLRVMIAWCYDKSIGSKEVKRMVIKRAVHSHPRLQLLPFLRCQGAIAGFAKQVLSSLISSPFPPAVHFKEMLLSAHETTLVLGINRQQLKEFLEKCILTKLPGRGKSDFQIAAGEILHLLETFRVNPCLKRKTCSRPSSQSLADLIIDIQRSKVESAGFDLAGGLNSLRIIDSHVVDMTEESHLDVFQASLILDVHPEVVRSLVKRKWLVGFNQFFSGGRKICFLPDEIKRFNETFVTAGALARSTGLNVTNFSEKLEYLGIKPVAGPRLDGALVYLYRRADIVGVDLFALKGIKGYATKTGRRASGVAVATIPGISIADAAKRLHISVQQTVVLLRRGILSEELTTRREKRVTEKSLENLLKLISSPYFIPLTEAVACSGYSERQFQVYFINTELVCVTDLYIWRLIHKESLEVVHHIRKAFFTAFEAGVALRTHRSYLPFLERKGLISSQSIGLNKKVKFYSRNSVIALAKELRLTLA